MIDNLVIIKPHYIPVFCTSCWQTHYAFQYGDVLILSSGCSHDPRRYFLDHDEYIAYVRRYEAEGGKHIDEWGGQQEALPLLEGVG